MITAKTLYKHMKKFLGKKTSRPCYEHMLFEDNKVIATESHILAIVKNYKAPNHWETADGKYVPDDAIGKMVDYKSVMPKEYRFTLHLTKENMDGICAILAAAAKINKEDGINVLCIRKKEKELWALSDGNMTLEFKLADIDIEDDFKIVIATEFTRNIFNFIKDSMDKETIDIKVTTNMSQTVVMYETDDLIFVQACISNAGKRGK